MFLRVGGALGLKPRERPDEKGKSCPILGRRVRDMLDTLYRMADEFGISLDSRLGRGLVALVLALIVFLAS